MSESEYNELMKEVLFVKKEVQTINIKLFDHEHGIAVMVHDNTVMRKLIEQEDTINKANVAAVYIDSTKKHLFYIWSAIISGIVTAAIYLWEKARN
jgi:hypothetical protein